ncbi:MAG: dihydroorotate dehydrogenase electron transfer subunit, partial [Nitrospirae bacterium]|nr:dihydroorotate dehydrogenase electron transfer subunit [Nitrospirota bacterium]
MNKYFSAKIKDNIQIAKHFYLLTLNPLSETVLPQPGQFYMLQTGFSNDPLLKRPFSVFKHKGGILKFLYRIRGKGTLSLSRLQNGGIIQVIGPLGNGYP